MQAGKLTGLVSVIVIGTSLLLDPATSHAANCSVSAPTLNFGNYDPLSASPTDSSTNISVSCSRTVASGTETVTYTLTLSSGPGSFSTRTMLQGASTLGYNLYKTSARDASSVWGDGTGGSTTVTASLPALTATAPIQTATHAVYGRIPARQDSPIGTYVASVVLTMTF
ncbi:MAG: spore coat protein U domain-containing protein [Rhodocyclaceae bacterium]|nr:spore coat protein U domain-containing protein [Rhodocyclaceae bacterium]